MVNPKSHWDDLKMDAFTTKLKLTKDIVIKWKKKKKTDTKKDVAEIESIYTPICRIILAV